MEGDNIPPDIPTTNEEEEKEIWKPAKEVFLEARVKWVMETFTPLKSLGVDGILPAPLQRDVKTILGSLSAAIRDSMALGKGWM